MRSKLSFLGAAAMAALLAVGCAGPEKKLGRGITNLTEFARMGEITRSMEQTYLWDGPSAAYATGFVRGLNRSLIRTVVGAYEVVTAPIPSYDPILRPGGPILPDATVGPAYPDSHKPGVLSSSTFETDSAVEFSGGAIAPIVPGSRFHIFDY